MFPNYFPNKLKVAGDAVQGFRVTVVLSRLHPLTKPIEENLNKHTIYTNVGSRNIYFSLTYVHKAKSC